MAKPNERYLEDDRHNDEFGFSRNLMSADSDDEFTYHCSCCADCCKRIKDTVALETLDLFNLSRYLRQSGNPVWRMEDLINEYTVPIPITDFGYPMFFINTTGPDDSCVFLKSGKCGIQGAKPRTCRMYPLTAEPINGGKDFNYYIITERTFHFSGAKIRVGDWMTENLNGEDREFTKMEVAAVVRIGRLMQKNISVGIDLNQMLPMLFHYKYLNYDTSRPFLPQYQRNISSLINLFSNMTKGR